MLNFFKCLALSENRYKFDIKYGFKKNIYIWGQQYLEIIRQHAFFLKMSCTCLKTGTTMLDKFDINLDFVYFLNIWGRQYLEIIRKHAKKN